MGLDDYATATLAGLRPMEYTLSTRLQNATAYDGHVVLPAAEGGASGRLRAAWPLLHELAAVGQWRGSTVTQHSHTQSHCPRSQQRGRPPTAPEAHPLARGCLVAK